MVNIDDEELEFLIQQVWKNRCATTGLRIGGHASLVLSRWNVDAAPSVSNLVLTTQAEATKLDELGPKSAFSESTFDYISKRLLWAKSVHEDDTFGNIRSIEPDGTVVLSKSSKLRVGHSKFIWFPCESRLCSAAIWSTIGAVGATILLKYILPKK